MTAATVDRPRAATGHLSPRLTAATAGRVLRQLRHDHRTIAMMLVLPSVLLGLLYLLWKDLPVPPRPAGHLRPRRPDDARDPPVRGHVPGHQHRDAPRAHLRHPRAAAHHAAGPAGPAARLRHRVRSGGRGAGPGHRRPSRPRSTTSTCADRSGWSCLIAVVDAVLGVALGLLASAFARTEFQAVQFMPVIVLPQFFLCGLLVPVDQMAGWLQVISNFLPLTYAVEALQEVGRSATATGTMWIDIAVVAGAALLALALAAATLRRRTS